METTLLEELEVQIKEKQKTVDYDVKEFTIELLILKYSEGIDDDENEIYIPDYQRAFVWDEERQSKFIESVILGLPIPYIFTAEMSDGRLEIVDGSQRIRTLEAFMNNKLRLTKLDVLEKLNGYYFEDLPPSRQRKFKNTSLRMIVLSEKSDDDVRFMMFERINTGSDPLKDMEKRLGSFQGKFTKFVIDCTKNELFKELTSFTKKALKRKEPEELILRFFAYSDFYLDFKGNVNDFLDNYVKDKNENGFDIEKHQKRFNDMLSAVKDFFPNGFIKFPDSQKTPRLRFEAIAVGTALAIEQKQNLIVDDTSWIDSEAFESEVAGHSSNSPKRVKSRIDFVKNKLLGIKP